MAPRFSGFTRASSLGPIAEFVTRRGGSIDRVFRDVDLPFALLERPDVLVPLREQFRLLKRAAYETGDAQFGASLGQEVRVSELSAFGKWVSAAPTLMGTIARAIRGLNAMLQTSTVLTLTRYGTIAQWSIEFLDPESDGRYQNELLGLCYLIDGVRCHAGRSWVPNLVLVTTARGTHKGSLEQILGTNISTGHRVPAILFDASLLEGEESKDEHDGLVLADEPAVPDQADELGTIAAVTGLALCEGYPRLDWVAGKLAVTRRTLQRKLSEGGTSFARVVDKLLEQSAQSLLADTAIPITEIALKLGYADAGHFTRAFRRWTGWSPSAYRRAHAGLLAYRSAL